jgi:cation diffusion facilitator CzcD-associated flavoprotein CzcO
VSSGDTNATALTEPSVDVAIIGFGFAGLATLMHLARVPTMPR